MHKLKLLSMLVLLSTTALTACATTRSTGTTTVSLTTAQQKEITKTAVCQSFEPITFDDINDTDGTIRQVREHNAAWSSYRCRQR